MVAQDAEFHDSVTYLGRSKTPILHYSPKCHHWETVKINKWGDGVSQAVQNGPNPPKTKTSTVFRRKKKQVPDEPPKSLGPTTHRGGGQQYLKRSLAPAVWRRCARGALSAVAVSTSPQRWRRRCSRCWARGPAGSLCPPPPGPCVWTRPTGKPVAHTA